MCPLSAFSLSSARSVTLQLAGSSSLTTSTTFTLMGSAALQLVASSQLTVTAGAVSTASLTLQGSSLQGLQLLSGSAVNVSVGVSVTANVPLSMQQGAVLQLQSGSNMAMNAKVTAANASVFGAGTLYLSGGSSWSAGSQVTCAVQLSSGTHTLYDLDAQTWQPPLLVLGQPGQCDYCYQAPVLLIVPSVLARASQLPSGSVAAYMSRLTFYGVSSPSIASVQVSSLYTLQVGVLDGIVSTAGYTGPPVYTLQSATSNVTAIQVATLTSAALYMTLRAVQLSVLETGSWSLLLTRAETTTLYSSSRLILSGASQLVVSGAVWTVAAGDSSAGLGLVFSSASRVQINASTSFVVSVPLILAAQAVVIIGPAATLAASAFLNATSCQVSGAGTLYLSGGSSWSAGSQVTCAVQLSSGTHTLYDLDAQTWQPPLLVLGQPGQCDYCYQAPVLLIVPSVLARASQLPSGSVAAYMSRLTFYGVSSPSIASVQVSSLYTLQVGVLDGIVSTAGYTGPPVYTLQSATSNVTAIQVATLTSAALYMTLRAVQLSVLETGSWSLLLTRAETTTLYSSSRLILSGASQLVVSGAVWTVAAGDSSAGLGLVFSSASRVQINASTSFVVSVPLILAAQAVVIIGPAATLAASAFLNATSCQVSGAGTLYLSGGSSWSAGSQVTCAVQLSSGTHTLYDLDAQTWQPPLLVLGQPGQCDYCYQAPVLLIVPSVLARASQLPSGSVAAYMSRLTFYGVSSPSIASVQVSSLYTLQVGVLDGIVSTAGYTGPPVYTLQSATSNVTAIQVATLTSAALYMTLRAVQLSVLETGSWSLLLTRAETTTLYSSSRLILSGASQLVVSGAVWTVAAGDSSAGLGLVFSSASRVQINASSSLVVRVPVTVPVGAALSIGLAGALTLSSPVSLSQATIQIAAGGALAASGYVTAASCQVSAQARCTCPAARRGPPAAR